MKPRAVILVATAYLPLVSVAAAADGRNVLSFWDEPPTIVVYDERCEVDVECWTESVSCDASTLVVTIGGFYTDQMTRWMMNGMEAIISGFGAVPQMRLRQITISDLDGLWYAELETSRSQPLDIDGEELVFDSTIRTTTVSLDEQNRAELTKFVAACRGDVVDAPTPSGSVGAGSPGVVIVGPAFLEERGLNIVSPSPEPPNDELAPSVAR